MWKPQTILVAAMFVLPGCAVFQHQTAADSEHILAEAGFRKEAVPPLAAQGATRAAGDEALPVRRLAARTEQGESVYRFYDPDFCHCVYVGGAKEFAELQHLRSARAAEHARMLAGWSPWASADPNVWGPWKPEGLDPR